MALTLRKLGSSEEDCVPMGFGCGRVSGLIPSPLVSQSAVVIGTLRPLQVVQSIPPLKNNDPVPAELPLSMQTDSQQLKPRPPQEPDKRYKPGERLAALAVSMKKNNKGKKKQSNEQE